MILNVLSDVQHSISYNYHNDKQYHITYHHVYKHVYKHIISIIKR